ncbi:MAG: glycoside hydrolase family 3 C-terminal domain-containing protein [Lachnospiraceae bacterium]|nr:glycoside hydrolase family 3 C-terminal domain-containing protein [Lachnospiraceae bacterium]
MDNSEKQINELISGMTLEEKVAMLHGRGFFRTRGVERLGIPELVMSDGPMGVRNQFPDDCWIPIGNSDDYVSYLVSNSALAATWNTDRAYDSGRILGEEARGRGKDVILAPGINIKRDPLCGRSFEYMSEDPYLISTMAVPFIEGVQENDVAACVKHFAANNQETDRLMVDTVVDERTLQEIYFPAFRAAVEEAGVYSLMNAYNKLNGFHCSENKTLLDEILRDKWKYDGTVISDWGSVHTTEEAAQTSIDIEMSVTTDFDEYYFAAPLIKAVRDGKVPEACIDAKVRNILRMMLRLKMIGNDALSRKQGVYDTEEHRRVILAAARESIVLLKNEGNMLPLTMDKLKMTKVSLAESHNEIAAPRKKKIAVIGKNAECRHAAGGGSAEIKALYEISPLLGLKSALGGNVEITYAQGYYIPGDKDVNEVNWQEASLERRIMGEEAPTAVQSEEQRKLREEINANRLKLKNEACDLARQSDIVIYVGGLNHDYDVEGRDRADMRLPYGQDELISELLDINQDTIIVMVAGSAVEMPWLNRAKALVWCYYSGMEAGTALSDILLGRVNPSAKLPETFPAVYDDTVTAKNGEFGKEKSIEYKEGIFVGYRYYEKEGIKPAFPFGYGLSYTSFNIEEMKLDMVSDSISSDLSDICVKINVLVKNTGAMAGAEVVQCYVSDCECSVERPLKELKAYKKIFLQPGETGRLEIELPYSAFAFYDINSKEFVVEPGKFVIYTGNSSDNCRLSEEIRLI